MQNDPNNREIPEILRGKTFLDLRYDPAFRAFFNDAEALTAFLNGILHLEGERRIESLEFSFADPIEFRTPEKQSVVFDIRATTADGLSNTQMDPIATLQGDGCDVRTENFVASVRWSVVGLRTRRLAVLCHSGVEQCGTIESMRNFSWP